MYAGKTDPAHNASAIQYRHRFAYRVAEQLEIIPIDLYENYWHDASLLCSLDSGKKTHVGDVCKSMYARQISEAEGFCFVFFSIFVIYSSHICVAFDCIIRTNKTKLWTENPVLFHKKKMHM